MFLLRKIAPTLSRLFQVFQLFYQNCPANNLQCYVFIITCPRVTKEICVWFLKSLGLFPGLVSRKKEIRIASIIKKSFHRHFKSFWWDKKMWCGAEYPFKFLDFSSPVKYRATEIFKMYILKYTYPKHIQ